MPRSKPNSAPGPPRPAHPATVSGRWLLAAIAIAVPGAALCAWAVLCLLFWQGSWQLLYHPTSGIARTPASAGLAFDPVAFATTDTGATQLQGWWISATSPARYTVLYMHGADGNLGDTLSDLALLHGAGVNLLAFDYRGYGQSRFVHPSESNWRQDSEWALQYLVATRHIDPRTIVLDGSSLGANLALEFAAAHPELAGVVLESPLDAPVSAIFDDPRARLVPAHILVSDRYDIRAPAAALRIPSLWFYPSLQPSILGFPEKPGAFQMVKSPKNLIGLTANRDRKVDISRALTRWLSDLPNHGSNLPLCELDDGFVC